MKKLTQRVRGFTLIELMIAVAVIGILASIAYPSYTEYVRKARRATAESALMDIASKQHTYLLSRRTFTASETDLGFSAPPELNGLYTFTIEAPSATTFSVKATPAGAQAAGGKEQELEINELGEKKPSAAGYWGK
ncbi:type IV pilin protein [Thauera sp.]|jgi:type IV pilus assembly protein PilE|uniref:type IV pilin protein n=1 Tax=Thauera sp. TaxID=1905334 RepID=UPI002A36D507|nr:type IV pilin protein [Thauera sp.]MDX9886922.1 type IV pilin protein [Thauera sp.]